jgi:hypothetical protein
LQSLQTQVAQLETNLLTIEKQLAALANGQTWYSYQASLANDISDIEAQYHTLQSLSATDTASAVALKSWGISGQPASYLLTLHEDITGLVLLDPSTTQGLLSLYSLLLVESFQADSAMQHDEVGPGSPLDVATTNMKQYFLYLIGVQTKCLTLLTNAYVASNEVNLATQAVSDFTTNLTVQCQVYLAAMEALIVGCTVDLSLMDVFGLVTSVNPLQQAGALIDMLLLNTVSSPPSVNTTFYARLWLGSGASASWPYRVFQTSTLDLTTADTQLSAYYPVLIDSKGNSILPDQMASTYSVQTLFPAASGCQWLMLRASWTNPDDDTYSIAMNSSTDQNQVLLDPFSLLAGKAWDLSVFLPVINALVLPGNLAQTQYFNPATTFTFSSSQLATNQQAVLIGSTSLFIGEPVNGLYAGDAAGSIGVYNFFTGDFSVACWINIPADFASVTGSGNLAILMSSKCAYGGTGLQWGTGASGFWLALTPQPAQDGDITYMLSMRLDDGNSFYEVDAQNNSLQCGQWYHVAAVRQSGQVTIYLDGVSLPLTDNPNNTSPNGKLNLQYCWNLMLGCSNGNSDLNNQNNFQAANTFTGNMNEAAIWSEALSVSQIQKLQLQCAAAVPSGLLGYWPLTGGGLYDQSGTANLTGASPTLTPLPAPTYLALGS